MSPPEVGRDRRVVLRRIEEPGHSLAANLVDLVRVLQAWQPNLRLDTAGAPSRPLDVSRAALESYLHDFTRARSQGIPQIFRLASRDGEFQLFFDREPTPAGEIAYVWFGVERDLSPRPERDRFLRMLASAIEAFDAYQAFLEDEALLPLYRGHAAFERARAALPSELRHLLPESEPEAIDFPELLLPIEFDRRLVPDAVWWVNFWDQLQINTLGADRVLSAPWARDIPLPGRGHILIATEEPTSPDRPSDIAALRSIIEDINLREAQERHRVKNN